jgi:hypothetical protein
MKKLVITLFVAGALMACNQPAKTAQDTSTATTANAANAAVMKFEFDSHDFGKIKQGDKVTYEFKFTNTGKSPLIISNATATCGCTTPEWPHTPLQPGEGGAIKVTFNSTGKSGLQDKLITVTANTNPAQSMVHLIGEVLTK